MTPAAGLQAARAELSRLGLLLLSDPTLPSLVALLTGEPPRTSWWSHPRAHLIYNTINTLSDDPDVLSMKLIAGKVTFVHRHLWPAVYAVARARGGWQLEGLSPAATWLLGEVDAEQEVQTDLLVRPASVTTRVTDATRELERRLLVHATEVHTPNGAHAKVLQTWPRWAEQVHLEAPNLSAHEARAQLEQAAQRLSAEAVNAVARLPWHLAPPRQR